jgi:hypothetical protein
MSISTPESDNQTRWDAKDVASAAGGTNQINIDFNIISLEPTG